MKVTVVIPAYNAGQFLNQTLESVYRQSLPADEVILVDDCSTDATREIALQYGVRVLSTGVNSGHAAARNIGIDAAGGDLIAWIDADDYWQPNHLQTVCRLFDEHPTAAVAFSAVQQVGTRSAVVNNFPCSAGPTALFAQCLTRTIVPAMSAVTRRGPLREVGGFDASIRIAPDFELWLRMSRRFLFVSSEAVTSNYRFHGNQISANWYMQKVSVNRSRVKLLSLMRGGSAEPLDLPLASVEQRVSELFEIDLERLWNRRRMREISLLAQLAPSLSGLTPRARRIMRAARMPQQLINVWDAARRVTQRR
jgi:glycosyltransferase involved in cell wall biosynthesis